MYYYCVVPIRLSAPPLIYHSLEKCENFEIVEIPLGKSKIRGSILKEVCAPNFETKKLEKTQLTFTQTQKKIASFLSAYYIAPLGSSLALFTPMNKVSPLSEERKNASNPILSPSIFPNLKSLTPDQNLALEFCQKKPISLIFGDTGSGKSEIYFHAISQALTQGKSSLLLMPEIALTPQMSQRLKKIFGERVGIWHSKVSKKHKQNLLRGLETKEISIILGARSALFLPMQNLGLIIIDEEHDDSYKSQKPPFYNAKNLALMLGAKEGIQIILGSATPSIVSYTQASKKQYLYRLKGGFHQSTREIQTFGEEDYLHPKVIKEVIRCLEEKKGVLFFLPNRGNFNSLMCTNCWHSIFCKHCSISLVVHANTLRCHYCGYTQAIPKSCPDCGNGSLSALHLGTKELKNNLIEAFSAHTNPPKIEILDSDHIHSLKNLEKILLDFENQNIDILIGTQIISKGHDFTHVGLCVVLGFDYLASFPDYSSLYKAGSLLSQVSGRVGRSRNGKLLIQTKMPDLIEKILKDFELFLQQEKQNYYSLYPPFVKLIKISYKHTKENKGYEIIQRVEHYLQNCLQNLSKNPSQFSSQDSKNQISHSKIPLKPIFEIIGAGGGGIRKIKNFYRFHCLLRVYSLAPTLRIMKDLILQFKNLSLDIDPLDLT